MHENWKPIQEAPAYLVSDLGRVKSTKNTGKTDSGNHILKPFCNMKAGGYMQLLLRIDGKSCKRLIHRLVCQAFIGPIPPGSEPNHKNSVRIDNRLDNLEIVTRSENHRHAYRTNNRQPTGFCKPKLTPDQVREIRRLCAEAPLLQQKEIAAMFGVNPPQVTRIKNGSRCARIA